MDRIDLLVVANLSLRSGTTKNAEQKQNKKVGGLWVRCRQLNFTTTEKSPNEFTFNSNDLHDGEETRQTGVSCHHGNQKRGFELPGKLLHKREDKRKRKRKERVLILM